MRSVTDSTATRDESLSIPAKLFLLGFPLFGSYLTIYLALNRKLPPVQAARFGDLSYGLYIYGWPAENLRRWWESRPSIRTATPGAGA